ncbi:MAG: DNRLRE domain-containing protein [Spirochaetes bacterium]|nr:DNRLRE domain-containing protein [Spirochaetota bacterium]
MKKFTEFILLIVLIVVFSCNPAGDETQQGDNEELFVINLQNGVSPTSVYNGCDDSYIESGVNAGICYGGSTQMHTGIASASGPKRRILIKFDLENVIIPSTVKIKKAYLTLYNYGGGGSSGYTDKMYAYKLITNWRQGTENGTASTSNVTWNDPGPGTWATVGGGGDFEIVSMSDTPESWNVSGYSTFSLNPSMVQSWINDKSKNYGLILKGQIENTSTMAYRSFYTSESGNLYYRPMLTVYYSF